LSELQQVFTSVSGRTSQANKTTAITNPIHFHFLKSATRVKKLSASLGSSNKNHFYRTNVEAHFNLREQLNS